MLEENCNITSSEIISLLPQDHPFLFIDKIVYFNQEDRTLRAVKNFTYNEYFFQGHFKNNPVVPGVLMIEAMAQASILLLKKLGYTYDVYYLSKIKNATFKKIVVPGDRLIIETKLVSEKMGLFINAGRSYVDSEVVNTADLVAYGK